MVGFGIILLKPANSFDVIAMNLDCGPVNYEASVAALRNIVPLMPKERYFENGSRMHFTRSISVRKYAASDFNRSARPAKPRYMRPGPGLKYRQA